MSKLYPFNSLHLFRAEKISWSPEILTSLYIFSSDPNYNVTSYFSGGRLQAIFCIKRIHDGIGECMALPCDGFGPIALHKGVLIALRYWKEVLKFRRLQATVVVGNKKDADWVERLGFKSEGVVRSYDILGRDHVMYGMVV